MRSLVSYGFLALPVVFISVALIGALATLVWQRIGMFIVLASTLCLFIAATPAFSSYLTHQIEAEIPASTEFSSAQAIVVLGADVQSAEGDLPDRLGPLSLERLVFAADAYRRLRLPMVVSGGRLGNMQLSLAELMETTLEDYFNIPVTWTEDQSQTTYQNALYTAQLLRREHISTVVLITQARDLPRAIWSFQQMGVHVLAWRSPRTPVALDGIGDFLPESRALQESFYALHEMIGRLYYRMSY